MISWSSSYLGCPNIQFGRSAPAPSSALIQDVEDTFEGVYPWILELYTDVEEVGIRPINVLESISQLQRSHSTGIPMSEIEDRYTTADPVDSLDLLEAQQDALTWALEILSERDLISIRNDRVTITSTGASVLAECRRFENQSIK